MEYDSADYMEPCTVYVIKATTKKGDTLTIRRIRGRYNYFICNDQRGEWYGDSNGTTEADLRNLKRRVSLYFGGVGRWRIEFE